MAQPVNDSPLLHLEATHRTGCRWKRKGESRRFFSAFCPPLGDSGAGKSKVLCREKTKSGTGNKERPSLYGRSARAQQSFLMSKGVSCRWFTGFVSSFKAPIREGVCRIRYCECKLRTGRPKSTSIHSVPQESPQRSSMNRSTPDRGEGLGRSVTTLGSWMLGSNKSDCQGVPPRPDQESDVAVFFSLRRRAMRFCSVRRLIPSISAARLRFPCT